MKKKKRNILCSISIVDILLVCLCLLPTRAHAASETDLTFTLNADGVSYSVTSIGNYVFSSCSGLISVTLPKGMTNIPEGTFASCSKLEIVTLPQGIKAVDEDAFLKCSSLKQVYYGGSEADWESVKIYSGNERLTYTDFVFAKTECNHVWNSGTVTKEATCKDAGEKVLTCAACGEKKTETVAKLTTHTYDNNCDTNCNVCGNTRTVSHQYSDIWRTSETEPGRNA